MWNRRGQGDDDVAVSWFRGSPFTAQMAPRLGL